MSKCRSVLLSLVLLAVCASTADAGEVLNKGLFDYKSSFGEGCVAQDFYQLDLRLTSEPLEQGPP